MPGSGSTVRSAARSERMKARWADPAYAAKERTRLAELNARQAAARAAKKAGVAPPEAVPPAATPPAGGGAPASTPFTDRRLFGRHRSS